MPNLLILAGVPGAGKSTFAKTFFDLKYAVVSSDAIRQELAGSLRAAHEEAIKPWDLFYQRIGDRLRQDVDVIADATFLTARHRTNALEVAWAHGATPHLILFINIAEAHLRNIAREATTRVPDDAMVGMERLYNQTLVEITQEPYKTVTKIAGFG